MCICYTRPIMVIAIPDDYHGLVARLECFKRLAAHDVRILRDAAPPMATLAANLRDADGLYFGEAFDNALAFASGKAVNILNPEALQRRPQEKG